MLLLLIIKILLFSLCMGIFGWLLFSLTAGAIIYFSSFTNNHVHLEPKKLSAAERTTVLYAHTKESRIMDPINAAKDRWFKNRDKGFFELVSVVSRDRLRLAGYYWPVPNNVADRERTVLIVHGMMDSAAGMGYLAEEYHAAGWNVLAIDLRSHGESEGTVRTMGIREGEDIELWVDLLVKKYGSRKIFLHGVSMGGAAVLLYASNVLSLPSPVKGLICDSAFARHDAVFSRLLGEIVSSRFVSSSLTLGASITSFLVSGISFGRMAPEKCIPKIAIPILLFHGQQDALVPIGMVRNMLGSPMKPGSESVVIPDAAHLGPYFFNRALYMQKIEDFYRRNE